MSIIASYENGEPTSDDVIRIELLIPVSMAEIDSLKSKIAKTQRFSPKEDAAFGNLTDYRKSIIARMEAEMSVAKDRITQTLSKIFDVARD